MLSTNGTTSKGDMTPCGRRQEDYGRKAHHSLVADCRRSRGHRRSGRARAGSHEQPAADTDTALAGEWFGPWIGAGILVVCGTGRRPLRVPARSRRRFQLAGARARRGQLYDAEHASDRPEDVPERNVLLARPLDRLRRLGIAVVGWAVAPQVVDRGGRAAVARRRRRPLLPDRPAEARLVGGAGRRELSRLRRQRSVARLTRL